MKTMLLSEFAQWIERATGQIVSTSSLDGLSVNSVAVDTRLVKPQDVFFALPGAKSDGHMFLAEAASKGAIAAVVSKSYYGPPHGMAIIKVSDVLKALQELAKILLSARNTKIIAVTGSVGKTTTKDFIATILREQYRVASSPGNSNSQIGLPLTILNHTHGDEDFLILEMGMTHPGQISSLVQIAPPYVAVLTTVELVHACNFESLEEIANAKAEIFSHDKTIHRIIPNQINHYKALKDLDSKQRKTFSVTDHNADYYIENLPEHMLVHFDKQQIKLPSCPISGQHILHNVAAAITVARSLGMDWDSIGRAIPKLSMPAKRMQKVEKNGILFINDSYNASPVSVKAALNSLPAPKVGGRTIAVLGDMLELGKFSDDCHREIGEAALGRINQMFCFGECCKPIIEVWKHRGQPAALYTDIALLIEELRMQLKPNDVVLLKGSNSKGLWRVLDAFEDQKD